MDERASLIVRKSGAYPVLYFHSWRDHGYPEEIKFFTGLPRAPLSLRAKRGNRNDEEDIVMASECNERGHPFYDISWIAARSALAMTKKISSWRANAMSVAIHFMIFTGLPRAPRSQ